MEIHIKETIWTRIIVQDDLTKEELIEAIKNDKIWDDTIFESSETISGSEHAVSVGDVEKEATIQLWHDDRCINLLYDNKSGTIDQKKHLPKELKI